MKKINILLFCLISSGMLNAQGLHFSQFYNAPMLLNPANTGLLQNSDWRVGTSYRNQWATVPVNYNTFSVFADLGAFRNNWETSWLGAGVAVWRDAAGDGNLALTRIQTNLAYHVLISERSSLSAGIGASYNQRSVDFSKLTFDSQWDEFSFNRNAPNLETNSSQKTTFTSISAGMNYSYYNNSNLYIKMSLAANNINQPIETFYGESNKLGLRPQVALELSYKPSEKVILNPMVYYTRQKKASELVFGSLFNVNTGEMKVNPNEVILGVFYRNKDAIIAAAGYKWKDHRVMVSYDQTISQMSQGNNGVGAFEISLILQGNYKRGDDLRETYGCPRF